MTINPKNPGTYTALGFSYHMKGDFRQALNCYHKANFLKHEDPLTEEMIQRALHDINEYSGMSGIVGGSIAGIGDAALIGGMI